MEIRKFFGFLFQASLVAIVAIIVVLLLKPELISGPKSVVEFRESSPASRQTQLPPGKISGPVSYADAVNLAAPAVVNIYTSKVIAQRANPLFEDPIFRKFFGDNFLPAPRERYENSLGSGVIVSTEGYIVTNNHVIADADTIQVQLRDGRNVPASIVGTDPETDIGILKIDLKDLPVITLGQSDEVRIGDVVLAIGNPFGVGQTVTMGIVSATGRSQLGINTFENFIQTDAAINPGNSGGALINPYGQLVGINTAIFPHTKGSEGIGFAIPVSLAKDVMRQIIEQGKVRRGWLGIEAQDITPELAETFNLNSTAGIIVAGIQNGGPADKADIRPGDVILSINGNPTNNARKILNLIAQARPGENIELVIMRNGNKITRTATVTERTVRTAK